MRHFGLKTKIVQSIAIIDEINCRTWAKKVTIHME